MDKLPKDPNQKNKDEKDREEFQPERQDPLKAQKTDTFESDEQKKIVQIVLEDVRVGRDAAQEWKAQKEIDLQHINAEKPSIIESLKKKTWMSDRNLGLCPGILDIYQATLLATCFNIDSIHFEDVEENDVDNKDNLEKFAKWMVRPREVNLEPEADDFIANRVSLGASFFKIDWEIKYAWVDKRIPVYEKAQQGRRRRITKYEVETEYRRFERARIKNIDNLDDFIIPSYGKEIQELPFVCEVIHIMLSDIEDLETRKIIASKLTDKNRKNRDGSHAIPKLAGAPAAAAGSDTLNARKSQYLGETQEVDPDGRDYPLDVYEWYGTLTREGKREKFRVWVEPTTETFLSGKPLRKIRRDNKFPYAGGPFRRIPGKVRGDSLTKLIAPLINALNNNYNQTADFQTITNLPFGFANFEDGFTKPFYEVEAGQIYPTNGDPSKAVYFPNLQRSLAWSYQDKEFLLEMIERLTGAASYFLTSQSQGATATRDNIVQEKSDTKFGIWVRRIQNDIAEAINMAITLYQDWAPPDLAKRVLGENGKQIIKNMSIDTLRGSYDAYMSPDHTAGSNAYHSQMMLWAFRELQQGSIWMSPQMNPRGNWLLTKETMKRQGIDNPEHYLPPQPTQKMEDDEEAKNEFQRFKAGDVFDPPEGDTPAVVKHYMTHMKQMETEFAELDEEYRPNFEDHLFKTFVNYQKFIQKMQQEQIASQLAARAAMNIDRSGLANPPAAPAPNPVAPNQPAPMMPPQQPMVGM